MTPSASGSSPAADHPAREEAFVLVLLLLVIIVAVVLGIIGAVAKGLLYLLIIGAVLLVADLVYLGWRWRRPGRRPQR